MKSWIIPAALLAAGLIAAPATASAASHGEDALAKAIAGDHRAERHVGRDDARNPKETLEFFGFEPSLTVIEVYPGGGWYTEILAPALRGHGQLIAAHFDAAATVEYMQRVRGEYLAKLAAEPDVYSDVTVIGYAPGSDDALGQPGSADLVVTFRGLHGFHRNEALDKFFSDAFNVLKSGGTLGVVQHRAQPEAAPEEGAYMPQAYVVAQAEAAGFTLAASAEINANPRDTADHPGGVWALPPTLRHGDEDREKYVAIGESDRMTLRFVKP